LKTSTQKREEERERTEIKMAMIITQRISPSTLEMMIYAIGEVCFVSMDQEFW
jgi:hypothetical protein